MNSNQTKGNKAMKNMLMERIYKIKRNYRQTGEVFKPALEELEELFLQYEENLTFDEWDDINDAIEYLRSLAK